MHARRFPESGSGAQEDSEQEREVFVVPNKPPKGVVGSGVQGRGKTLLVDAAGT